MQLPNRTQPGLDGIGTVHQPASGRVEVTEIFKNGPFYRLDLKLTKARVPVTDAAASGSYGSLKLFTFDEGAVSFLGSRQDYTAYKPDGTGVPVDAAFEIGVGTAAIAAAADGTLGNGVNEDIGQAVSQTLSTGTTTGTAVTSANAVANGTSTPATVNLNMSGSADTIDGNGTLDVTGTISINFTVMGDD